LSNYEQERCKFVGVWFANRQLMLDMWILSTRLSDIY